MARRHEQGRRTCGSRDQKGSRPKVRHIGSRAICRRIRRKREGGYVARRRMIDPAIWDSEQVQSLTGDEFKLYVYLISNSDDEGRIQVNPMMLQSKCFPLREDRRSIDAASMINRLRVVELVRLYTDGHCTYLCHPNWSRYQTIDRPKPSHLPNPIDCIYIERIDDQSTINRRRVVPKRRERKRREGRRRR